MWLGGAQKGSVLDGFFGHDQIPQTKATHMEIFVHNYTNN